MARFCCVAPPRVLEGLNDLAYSVKDGMGFTHLTLAHDIAANQAAYAKTFGSLDNHQQRYIILDNSVIELGHAVGLDIIKAATHTIKPTCIVLPDVLRDTTATILSCKRAIDEWWIKLDMESIKSTFLYIPQATNTLNDFVRCAEALADDPRIGYWGIPRNLVKALGTRRDAIDICNSLNRKRLIHMFGFSDDMVDDVICARNPYVYSIDSAVPLRLPTRMSLLTETEPRGDWWETGIASATTLENVNIARKWFQHR